jgi:hypothetical protein
LTKQSFGLLHSKWHFTSFFDEMFGGSSHCQSHTGSSQKVAHFGGGQVTVQSFFEQDCVALGQSFMGQSGTVVLSFPQSDVLQVVSHCSFGGFSQRTSQFAGLAHFFSHFCAYFFELVQFHPHEGLQGSSASLTAENAAVVVTVVAL